MMTMDTFLEKLMNEARTRGITEAEAYLTQGESRRITARDGAVEEATLRTTAGLSFRAMVEGKLGYASTEALDETSIDLLLTRAIDNAHTVESEDEQFLYAPQASDVYEPVEGCFNQELADKADIPFLRDVALRLEKAVCSADERILRAEYCLASSGSGHARIANTHGLNLSFASNWAQMYVIPVAQDGEGMVTADAFFAGNALREIDPEAVGLCGAQKALANIGATPVKSGNYPLLFDNLSMTALVGTYASVFSAEAAQRGLSLLAGKEGEAIAAPHITLMDDPLLPRGFASCPFDDEGVPTRTKSVIEGGTLRTLLHNLKTAKKAGVATTGNASKAGYAAPVSVSPSNFYLQAGTRSQEALLQTMGHGLYITEMNGLHAGANPITGDFSIAARGFLVENGQITRPVNQITVSGNFYKVLHNIAELGNDLLHNPFAGYGCTGSPCALVEGLTVAGS